MEQTARSRSFGRTGLVVPPISIGTARWRDGTARVAGADLTDAMLSSLTDADQPIVLDTANSYGNSEQRIGDFYASRGGVPEHVLIQTKADRDFTTGDFSGARMRRSLQESCDRLQLPTLPMVYIHDPENTSWDEAMATDGPVAALIEARDAGIIGHLGLSGGTVDVMERYVRTGHFEAVISHMRWTLVDRSADALFSAAQERGMGIMNAAPYGGGLLAQYPPVTSRYAYGEAAPDVASAADSIGRACAELDIPLAAVALQFSARDERIHSTIVGVLEQEDWDATSELLEVEVPQTVWDVVEAVLPPESVWQR